MSDTERWPLTYDDVPEDQRTWLKPGADRCQAVCVCRGGRYGTYYTPCEGKLRRGRPYCFMHDPEIQTEGYRAQHRASIAEGRRRAQEERERQADWKRRQRVV